MIKIAVYGKGGIGESTTVSNLAVALAESGLRVMQIGCDPKADSTLSLRQGQPMETVLDLIRTKPGGPQLEEMVRIGYGGVACVEAGGPTPGMGCAGRGMIAAGKSWPSKRPMRSTSRMWYSTMSWGMSSAGALPCPCAAAMPTGCLS